MIYEITRPLAKIALGLYFRKIYIVNMDGLPKDKPIMLAANHPTAFIEPVILACWMPGTPSFLARGDLYQNNPIVKKLYDWYHITPIFRREDTGYSNLKSNYETFEKCFETLKKKKPLMILAEGRTEHEKRLRPIRKGTARIIFGAFEKHGDMDIHLVPVGVNYTNSDAFRSVAMIEFGTPIRCSDYHEMYQSHPAKAINHLTKEMANRLKEKVVHINDPKDDPWVEQYLTLAENDIDATVLPVSSPSVVLFNAQKNISEKSNGLSEAEKDKAKTAINRYFDRLEKNGISDFGLMNRKYTSFKYTLLLIIGLLPALAGLILNFIPVAIGTTIANRLAPSIEFRAAMGIFFSSFFYLVFGLILYSTGLIIGLKWWVFALLLFPLLGYAAILYKHFGDRWLAGFKANRLKKDKIDALMKERSMVQKVWQ